MEADLEGVLDAITASDEASLQVDVIGNGGGAQLIDGVVAALGQGVQHHVDGDRILEQSAVGLDDAPTGQGMADHHRDDPPLDEGGDLLEQGRGGVLVGVEATDELLPGVQRQLGDEGMWWMMSKVACPSSSEL